MPLDFHKLSTSNVNINQYLQKVLKHQIVLVGVHLTTGFWVREEANLLLSLHFHLFLNISALSKVENTGLAGLEGKCRKLLSYKINRPGFFLTVFRAFPAQRKQWGRGAGATPAVHVMFLWSWCWRHWRRLFCESQLSKRIQKCIGIHPRQRKGQDSEI